METAQVREDRREKRELQRVSARTACCRGRFSLRLFQREAETLFVHRSFAKFKVSVDSLLGWVPGQKDTAAAVASYSSDAFWFGCTAAKRSLWQKKRRVHVLRVKGPLSATKLEEAFFFFCCCCLPARALQTETSNSDNNNTQPLFQTTIELVLVCDHAEVFLCGHNRRRAGSFVVIDLVRGQREWFSCRDRNPWLCSHAHSLCAGEPNSIRIVGKHLQFRHCHLIFLKLFSFPTPPFSPSTRAIVVLDRERQGN